MAFAASGLLCILIELGHVCTSGLPSETEHSLRQRSERLLYLPAGFPIWFGAVSDPEVLVALSSGSLPAHFS